MFSAFYICCIYSSGLKARFFIELNNMNLDQKAPIWVHISCSIDLVRTEADERMRERSGSVVECLTRDRGAAGLSLTGITVLCP